MRKIKELSKYLLILLALICSTLFIAPAAHTNALALPLNNFASGQCGSNQPGTTSGAVPTSIDFGCDGDVCLSNKTASYCTTYHNPIVDLIFAIIRILTDGVGLVIIASLIIAGIQYTFSRGDPQSVASATRRIQSTVTALALFVFAYALLNYIVPNGLFGQ